MNHATPAFITDQIKASPKQSWLRGSMDKDGWFVIKNLLSGRVLTAMKSFEKPMIAGNQDISSMYSCKLSRSINVNDAWWCLALSISGS